MSELDVPISILPTKNDNYPIYRVHVVEVTRYGRAIKGKPVKVEIISGTGSLVADQPNALAITEVTNEDGQVLFTWRENPGYHPRIRLDALIRISLGGDYVIELVT